MPVENKSWIVIILCAIAVLFGLSTFLPGEQNSANTDNIGYAINLYQNFSPTINSFSSSNILDYATIDNAKPITFSISDDAVYKIAYVSVNGTSWQPINLTGTVLSGNWLKQATSGTYNVPRGNIPNGTGTDNYLIIYSCTKNITGSSTAWDCHNNKWQIKTFNTTKTDATNPSNPTSKIQIYAAGRSGGGAYPMMDLLINNIRVASFNVTGDPLVPTYIAYNYTYAGLIDKNTLIRINYTNDLYGTTRDLRVDKIIIDGTTYESESPININTGIWDGVNCGGVPYSGNEWLNCSGYIQYNLSGSSTPSCTSQYSSSCYNGNVYWYNSCGTREGIKTTCNSSQTCPSTVCVNNPIPGKTIHIFIIGDSTAAYYPSSMSPLTGWGMQMQQFFDATNVVVVNNALSGASSKSYLTSDFWSQTNSAMGSGDFLFIQFAHNDEYGSYTTDPYTTYQDYLQIYIDAARAKGVYPVLLTPVERNQWVGSTLTYSHGNFPAAMMALANEQNVPLIDLTNKTRTLYYSIYNTLGQSYLDNNYFYDVTIHFKLLGANETAKLVIQGLQELGSSSATSALLPYIKGVKQNCTPTTCAAQGKNCGSISNNCGGTLSCGTCSGSTPVCTNNVCVSIGTVEQAKYYVATPENGGSDSNPGTISQPFATWEKLESVMKAGDLAYIRGGTYKSIRSGSATYHVEFSGLNGAANNYIRIWAYPGEHPILNLSNIDVTSSYVFSFYVHDNSYLYLKGLRITGIRQPVSGIAIRGMLVSNTQNSIFEQMEVDHIGGFGITVESGSSNILFKNCDTNYCSDPYTNYVETGKVTPYENANGFGITGASTATNIVFDGCRAWKNSDDGWDFFGTDGFYTINNSWSFWNGYDDAFTVLGNGQGFKLGPTGSDKSTTHLRTVTNSIAAKNRNNGFDQNTADFSTIYWIYNDVAYDNGAVGFEFGYPQANGIANVFRNNIAYSNDGYTQYHFNSGAIQSTNSWNTGIPAVSDADFQNLDVSQLAKPRNADGSLPNITFMHLNKNSGMIDKGTPISGISYNGYAPDLGAFEYQ